MTGTGGTSRRAAGGRSGTARRRIAIGRWRAMPRRRSKLARRPRLSTSRSMALQNRSRTCGTTTMLVTRWSRSASKMTRGLRLRTYRMSAPDIERVVQADGLLEQVAERQERDDPVVHRRDDPVERLDGRDDVVVGQHHALRRAGRAAREDELEDLVGRRGAPGRLAGLPVGREGGSSSPGSAHSASTVVVGKSARPASRGSGASRPVPRMRCRQQVEHGDDAVGEREQGEQQPADGVGRHALHQRPEQAGQDRGHGRPGAGDDRLLAR